MNANFIEQESQDQGEKIPRSAQNAAEATIASEHYFTAAHGVIGNVDESGDMSPALDMLTFCVLVLKNGFTITGESSCASPEKYDFEKGKEIARKNAVRKLGMLMLYERRCRAYAASLRPNPAHGAPKPPGVNFYG